MSQALGRLPFPVQPAPGPNPLDIGASVAPPGLNPLGTASAIPPSIGAPPAALQRQVGGPGAAEPTGALPGGPTYTPPSQAYAGRSPAPDQGLVSGAPVTRVYDATRPIEGAATPTYYELHPAQGGAEAFHSNIAAAKQAHPQGAAVTLYPPEDYRNMRLFQTGDGRAGFALKGNDIVSVFKHPEAKLRNVTRSMLDVAVNQGGRRLDAFDTVLPHLYSDSGFRAVARIPFSDQFAPEGWNHEHYREYNEGRPDVTFMVHDPRAGHYQPWDGPMVADYDAGTRAQHEALARIDRGEPEPGYGTGQVTRIANPLTVYHGTGATFAPRPGSPLGAFDLSKIGTGEGAQVYGHGQYVAANEDIAKHYRDALGGLDFSKTAAGGPISDEMRDILHERSADLWHRTGGAEPDWPSVAGHAWDQLTRQRYDALKSGDMGAFQRVENLRDELSRLRFDPPLRTGNLYQSELHIHPDHLLDWDMPLRQQSPYVQDRLHRHWLAHRETHAHQTGEQIYNSQSGLSEDAAPRVLLQAGIPGIRYADASTRDYMDEARRLEGRVAMMRLGGYSARDIEKEQAYLQLARQRISHNYVVFDPRTLHIVRRNGLPAMVAAGADALADHKRRSG